METFGLSEDSIKGIVGILASNQSISEIILFGSRAKGNYSVGSDIDIAIKGTGLSLKDISKALVEIDELFLPYKIDLIIYDRIKEPALIEHIDTRGIVLLKKNSQSS